MRRARLPGLGARGTPLPRPRVMSSGKVWTCWIYFGNLEGPRGGPPDIQFVACSPACMAKFKPGKRRCHGPAEFAPGELGPDGKSECPTCGRRVAVTRHGRLASHKPDHEERHAREKLFQAEELARETRALLEHRRCSRPGPLRGCRRGEGLQLRRRQALPGRGLRRDRADPREARRTRARAGVAKIATPMEDEGPGESRSPGATRCLEPPPRLPASGSIPPLGTSTTSCSG